MSWDCSACCGSPKGRQAARGAYVTYPVRELLAILALESVRRRALIIGEDLGTVPPRIRRELGKSGVFSYRVFYFERDGNGHFLAPEAYPARAMATVTTHDLPTLTGFWQGNDLALKRTLKLYPDAQLAEADAAAREQDRRMLLEDLKHRGLLGEGAAGAARGRRFLSPGAAGGSLGLSGPESGRPHGGPPGGNLRGARSSKTCRAPRRKTPTGGSSSL